MHNSLATMPACKTERKEPLTLMDLPTEIHLEVVEICLLHPAQTGHPRSSSSRRKLLGGSLRELTLVNRYFRELTAPYLFKNICINDMSTATCQDLLRDSMRDMKRLNTSLLLKNTKKFTVSLTRTPQPNRGCIQQDLIDTLDYIRPPIQRFVIEQETTQWPFLQKVRKIWNQWQGYGTPHLILDTKQLELSAPWGHVYDFQFLTQPYIHMERLWLDFDPAWLRPTSLNLSRFPFLQYIMIRAFPRGGPRSNEWHSFHGSRDNDFDNSQLGQLAHTLPHLKHFAMCGQINGNIKTLAPLLEPMKSLEQLDITDQQPISLDEIIAVPDMLHPIDSIDKAMCYSHLTRKHPANTDRTDAATAFFDCLPGLQRICLVRDQVGTMYHAVRDEAGALERVEEGEVVAERRRYLGRDNSKLWRCGFPNVLGYELFEPEDLVGYTTLWSRQAFWLDPAWLAGDKSVVPAELEWDYCMKKEFGEDAT